MEILTIALVPKLMLYTPSTTPVTARDFRTVMARSWPEFQIQIMQVNTCIISPSTTGPLPVLPITARPSITLESADRSEDDLTHKLVDILRINQRLEENINSGAPQLIIEDLWDLLQYHVATYFDNGITGIPPARHRR